MFFEKCSVEFLEIVDAQAAESYMPGKNNRLQARCDDELVDTLATIVKQYKESQDADQNWVEPSKQQIDSEPVALSGVKVEFDRVSE